MKKLTIVICAALSAAFLVVVGLTAADSRADGRKFHGFCRCGCSTVPNCATSADCGGSACSATISCC